MTTQSKPSYYPIWSRLFNQRKFALVYNQESKIWRKKISWSHIPCPPFSQTEGVFADPADCAVYFRCVHSHPIRWQYCITHMRIYPCGLFIIRLIIRLEVYGLKVTYNLGTINIQSARFECSVHFRNECGEGLHGTQEEAGVIGVKCQPASKICFSNHHDSSTIVKISKFIKQWNQIFL